MRSARPKSSDNPRKSPLDVQSDPNRPNVLNWDALKPQGQAPIVEFSKAEFVREHATKDDRDQKKSS